jgi:hypothetical protein
MIASHKPAYFHVPPSSAFPCVYLHQDMCRNTIILVCERSIIITDVIAKVGVFIGTLTRLRSNLIDRHNSTVNFHAT